MYENPGLSVGVPCVIAAMKNCMAFSSLHILSVPITAHVKPLVPLRSVRILPSLSMRTTAACKEIARGAAESAWAVYCASEITLSCENAALASNVAAAQAAANIIVRMHMCPPSIEVNCWLMGPCWSREKGIARILPVDSCCCNVIRRPLIQREREAGDVYGT